MAEFSRVSSLVTANQPELLPEPLSERELDVLRLVTLGLSNQEIAERLFISAGTAKTHIHNLCGKLGAHNRTEAANAGEAAFPRVSEEAMTTRRQLARERLEIYLVHLLLAYRRLLFFVGLLLLTYVIAILFENRLAGCVALVFAVFILLLSNSFKLVLYTARVSAWVTTLWWNDG